MLAVALSQFRLHNVRHIILAIHAPVGRPERPTAQMPHAELCGAKVAKSVELCQGQLPVRSETVLCPKTSGSRSSQVLLHNERGWHDDTVGVAENNGVWICVVP